MEWNVEYTDEFEILLIGGDKTGDNRWYDKHVPLADKIYDAHIDALKRESN